MEEAISTERVDAVLTLLEDFEPWERALVRAALREPPALKIHDPGAVEWTEELEREAVLQGCDGPDDVPLTVYLTDYVFDEAGIWSENEPLPFEINYQHDPRNDAPIPDADDADADDDADHKTADDPDKTPLATEEEMRHWPSAAELREAVDFFRVEKGNADPDFA